MAARRLTRQMTDAYQGLSTQGKMALILGGALFVGTDIMTGRIQKDPLASAFALGMVALTTFNIECLAKPMPCPNWAWLNVAALGAQLLAFYTIARKK